MRATMTAGLVLLAAGVALGACVHASPYAGPHGERQVVVACNAGLVDQSDCYAAAREACGGDYEVLSEGSDAAEFFIPGPWCLVPNVVVSKRGLNVRCSRGAPDTRAATTPARQIPPAAIPGACKSNDDCGPGLKCVFGTGVEGTCSDR